MDGGRENLLHLYLHIDELEPRGGILELLRSIRPQWKPQDIHMKENDCVLVRLYGRMTELYVNREREVQMFQVLHSYRCGPQIYCTFQNGICYEFVPGTVLDDTLVRQPPIYRLIAAEMGKIHCIRPEGGQGEPFIWTKMSHFLALLLKSRNISPVAQRRPDSWVAFPGVPSFGILSGEMETLKRHLSQIDSPVVLCHNDLLIKNIIYNHTDGMVKFIDYEYADYNYQAFDIGNHFNEFAGVEDINYSRYPGVELQRDWLTAYLESYKHSSGLEVRVTDAEVTQLYVQVCKFSLASNFFWGLWAIFQSRHSTIHFNFQRYATARLSYYFKKKEEYFGMNPKLDINSGV
ncbi:ethanolamine kinase 2 isoform X2 [Takifugu flavidus]|uniref:ethanolamine kinase 2 isoform X2 n=1 Tax=Takifugu flavidus TaxID=433684 RepID=UPI0025441B4F|nr:ethanolamine kinase 2 isoform X2 [Takifugu flavidus]